MLLLLLFMFYVRHHRRLFLFTLVKSFPNNIIMIWLRRSVAENFIWSFFLSFYYSVVNIFTPFVRPRARLYVCDVCSERMCKKLDGDELCIKLSNYCRVCCFFNHLDTNTRFVRITLLNSWWMIPRFAFFPQASYGIF